MPDACRPGAATDVGEASIGGSCRPAGFGGVVLAGCGSGVAATDAAVATVEALVTVSTFAAVGSDGAVVDIVGSLESAAGEMLEAPELC